MDAAHEAAKDLLRMRMSTPLSRLGSAGAIQAKVSFPAADPELDGVLVVCNSSPSSTTVPNVGDGWTLHDVQAKGTDEIVKQTSAGNDAVTVPARTTAVFVRR